MSNDDLVRIARALIAGVTVIVLACIAWGITWMAIVTPSAR